MKLEPGMRVRCVDDSNHGGRQPRLLEGKEYTVWDADRTHVRVVGVDFTWLRNRFKPVVRVKAPTIRPGDYCSCDPPEPATPSCFGCPHK